MMKKLTLVFAVLLHLASFVRAQVTCEPVFPTTADNNVVITYDASQGNAALNNATADIYIHTGVITNLSSGLTDWKYVQTTWGTADARWKMTPVPGSPNKYTFNIGNIRTYYAVPAAETVQKIACVFRNASGSAVGRSAAGADMYYDVYSAGAALQTLVLSPEEGTCPIKTIGSSISFRGVASVAGTLTLTDNGVTVGSASNARELISTINVTTGGNHNIVFTAVSGATTVTKSFSYVVANATATAALPANTDLGANWVAGDTAVVLRLDAPGKTNVFAVGSFSNWQLDTRYQMAKTPDGNSWWIRIGGITAGSTQMYQYQVGCDARVSDPLSTLVLDPGSDTRIPSVTFPNMPTYPAGQAGIVTVLKSGGYPYTWRATNWTRPQKSDLMIYELLPRDWVARHDYQTIIDSINYFKRLGITAIELMPVSEFGGNDSWGYNPNHHMALDKYYGTPEKFKELVDLCHLNGIAVILDVVFNHTMGPSALEQLYWDAGTNRPAANNPWLNPAPTHDFNVGSDMNHESQFTRNYVKRCLKYWLTEYKVDGFRFDLSKGFTQRQTVGNIGAWGAYDQSRVDILQDYHTTVQNTTPGAYTILEHFADGVEETELANRGMMVWANATGSYQDAAMGFGNDISWVAPKRRGWSDAKHDKHIGYLESHDEERMAYKTQQFGNQGGLPYDPRATQTAMRRQELAGAFFFTVPGPKMYWQFGELGYDISINQGGRVSNKPILWDYYTNPDRRRVYNVWGNLSALRKQYPNVFARSTAYNEADLNSGYRKHFHITEANLKVTIFANFDVIAQNVTPFFQNAGTWYDYLSGGSLNVTDPQAPISMLPGEYRVYLSVQQPEPPLGYVRFRVGTKDIAQYLNNFSVYPNPATPDDVRVGYTLRQSGDVQWQIFDLQGRLVLTSPLQNRLEGSHEDRIGQKLATGTYVVKLNVNGESTTQKLVIQ
ncbi:MAG: hypothetical protein RL757_239 [Bacteroidota bacterium]|jgi:1,4-alpha-glucan branching enzyme